MITLISWTPVSLPCASSSANTRAGRIGGSSDGDTTAWGSGLTKQEVRRSGDRKKFFLNCLNDDYPDQLGSSVVAMSKFQCEYESGTHRGILRWGYHCLGQRSHETGGQEVRRPEEVFLELS